MSNFTTSLAFVVSLLTFLFFFWRRLREDFEPPVIFRSGLLIVAGFAVGSATAGVLLPRFLPSSAIFSPTGLWFWGAGIGLAIGFAISYRVFKLPFYESLEAAVVGFLFASPFITREWIYEFISLCVYYYLRSHYKSFSWYKSGKVGFAGLATMGVFFLVRSILALVGGSMIVFTGIGKVEVVLCAALSFLSFFAVYNLSENT